MIWVIGSAEGLERFDDALGAWLVDVSPGCCEAQRS